MERDNVKETVFGIIESFIKENSIEEHYYIDIDMGFDSLDFVEFVIFIEKEFKLIIPDNIMQNMYSLQIKDIIDYIHKEVNK